MQNTNQSQPQITKPEIIARTVRRDDEEITIIERKREPQFYGPIEI